MLDLSGCGLIAASRKVRERHAAPDAWRPSTSKCGSTRLPRNDRPDWTAALRRRQHLRQQQRPRRQPQRNFLLCGNSRGISLLLPPSIDAHEFVESDLALGLLALQASDDAAPSSSTTPLPRRRPLTRARQVLCIRLRVRVLSESDGLGAADHAERLQRDGRMEAKGRLGVQREVHARPEALWRLAQSQHRLRRTQAVDQSRRGGQEEHFETATHPTGSISTISKPRAQLLPILKANASHLRCLLVHRLHFKPNANCYLFLYFSSRTSNVRD